MEKIMLRKSWNFTLRNIITMYKINAFLQEGRQKELSKLIRRQEASVWLSH